MNVLGTSQCLAASTLLKTWMLQPNKKLVEFYFRVNHSSSYCGLANLSIQNPLLIYANLTKNYTAIPFSRLNFVFLLQIITINVFSCLGRLTLCSRLFRKPVFELFFYFANISSDTQLKKCYLIYFQCIIIYAIAMYWKH